MQLANILSILAVSGLSYASENRIDVFGKSLKSGSIVELGQIEYDTAANTTAYHKANELPTQDSICLGTKGIANKECFSYTETKESVPKGRFTLFLNEKREVFDIAFQSGGDEWTAKLVDAKTAPLPNLEPFLRSNQKQKEEPVMQKVIVKKVVEVDGKEVEVEEEVEQEVTPDNRSWIQKNWLWIAIPLIAFSFLAPEEEKKKEE